MSAHLIFEVLRGDPVSALSFTREGCIAGTLCGRSVARFFTGTLAGKNAVITSWQEDAIRGVWFTDSNVLLTVGDISCRMFKRDLHASSGPTGYQECEFDKRQNPSVRYVLQRKNMVLIVASSLTLIVDLTDGTQSNVAWRMADRHAAACDWDGKRLLLHTASPGLVSTIQIVVPADHERICSFELPKSVFVITLMRLWGDKRVVYARQGTTLAVYDYTIGDHVHRLKGHKGDVVGVAFPSDTVLVSVDAVSVLKVWDCSRTDKDGGGICVKTISIKPCVFDLGWPYKVEADENLIAITGDDGVYIVDIDEGEERQNDPEQQGKLSLKELHLPAKPLWNPPMPQGFVG